MSLNPVACAIRSPTLTKQLFCKTFFDWLIYVTYKPANCNWNSPFKEWKIHHTSGRHIGNDINRHYMNMRGLLVSFCPYLGPLWSISLKSCTDSSEIHLTKRNARHRERDRKTLWFFFLCLFLFNALVQAGFFSFSFFFLFCLLLSLVPAAGPPPLWGRGDELSHAGERALLSFFSSCFVLLWGN